MLLDHIVKRRGGVLLDECTFVSCIIRMEVLRLCFDVEPLPNKGLGPGQLFAHQSQPKQDQRRTQKREYERDGAANLETRLPCSCLNCHLSLSQCFLMQLQGICSSLLRTSKLGRFLLPLERYLQKESGKNRIPPPNFFPFCEMK